MGMECSDVGSEQLGEYIACLWSVVMWALTKWVWSVVMCAMNNCGRYSVGMERSDVGSEQVGGMI